METKQNLAMMKEFSRMPIAGSLVSGFEAMGWAGRLPQVCRRTVELRRENAGASKALQTHLKQLLPMIALYEAAVEASGSKEEAMAFMDAWAFLKVEKMVSRIRPLMKLGLYRLMPGLCSAMLDKLFGKAAGFDYRSVPEAPAFAADMTRCPYVDTCARYGCPELARISCKADDIAYGQLHPKLLWGRTQTLGTGGSCCDFRLYIKERSDRQA